ncbi:MAG: hypothetical protein GXO23_01270 [Crenarchaeota archaeon]|nr:hypothetical protein [Thermoproteota archaeon]
MGWGGGGWGRGRGRGGGWGGGGGGGGWGRGRGGGWGGGGWGWAQAMPQMPAVPPPPPGAVRAVASVETNAGLDSIISPRFGRAPFFAVVDVAGGRVANVHIVQNPCIDLPHGAGVAVAQWILSIGARCAIGSHFGPNVMAVLQQAGVRVCMVQPGIRLADALKVCGLV